MSLAKSSITYLNIAPKHHKANVPQSSKLAVNFNFGENTVKSKLYCYFTKNIKSYKAISATNESPTLANKRTTKAPKLEQTKMPKRTVITTVNLFEHYPNFTNTSASTSTHKKSPVPQKWLVRLTIKINEFFALLIK